MSLRNIQAIAKGESRRAKKSGKKVEPVGLQHYTQDNYVTDKVLNMDRKPETQRGGKGFIHGSSLINLCERMCCIRNTVDTKSVKVPKSCDRLVWAIGRAVEHHIRIQFIAAVGGSSILARWKCMCGKTHSDGFLSSNPVCCKKCLQPVKNFSELPLFDYTSLIVGNSDLIYLRPDNNKFRVNEIKSMNKKQFDALTQPMADHIWQALIYRRLLKINEMDVDDTVAIIYGCKDYSFKGLPYKEYTIDATEDWREKQLDKFWEMADRVKAFAADRKLDKPKLSIPPITLCGHADCTRAKECPVGSICFSLKK
tara:strand:+ start:19265 stop:20197 length:933 start_codon:yes stop_codon:yes gene_type:complete